MRDSVPSGSYSSVCNVLRQWNIPLIPTYRVYRLYDIMVFKMRDSVPSTRYSSVCNVLRQWNIPLIPTYRVYRLYDIYIALVLNSKHKAGHILVRG